MDVKPENTPKRHKSRKERCRVHLVNTLLQLGPIDKNKLPRTPPHKVARTKKLPVLQLNYNFLVNRNGEENFSSTIKRTTEDKHVSLDQQKKTSILVKLPSIRTRKNKAKKEVHFSSQDSHHVVERECTPVNEDLFKRKTLSKVETLTNLREFLMEPRSFLPAIEDRFKVLDRLKMQKTTSMQSKIKSFHHQSIQSSMVI